MKFTDVAIIYNPNSTGPSDRYAKDLRGDLKKLYPNLNSSLHATKHAGHAETLAYTCAKASKNPLIISSSGDGGYNEVINGALRAQNEGAHPVCAILAAGNANDHSRTVLDGKLLDAIKAHKETSIDVIEIIAVRSGKKISRYAHSYIGLGLTPVVAVELNKTDLSKFKELVIVARTFFKLRPFKITVGQKTHKLDSIIFANINEMAKILTLSKNPKPDDGKFEVILFKHTSKLSLVRKLLVASTAGIDDGKQVKKYTFTVRKRTPLQLDGEILYVDKGSEVTVHSRHQMLRTIA